MATDAAKSGGRLKATGKQAEGEGTPAAPGETVRALERAFVHFRSRRFFFLLWHF